MTADYDTEIDYENIGIIEEENEIEFPECPVSSPAKNLNTATGWLFQYFDGCNAPKSRFVEIKYKPDAEEWFEENVTNQGVFKILMAYRNDY